MDGKKRESKSSKAGLVFPVGRVHRKLKQGNYSNRTGTGASIYMAAVMEYLTAEVLEIAGNVARDNNKKRITPRHIEIARSSDSELAIFLSNVDIPEGGVMPNINPALLKPNSKKKTKISGEASEANSQEIEGGTQSPVF